MLGVWIWGFGLVPSLTAGSGGARARGHRLSLLILRRLIALSATVLGPSRAE